MAARQSAYSSKQRKKKKGRLDDDLLAFELGVPKRGETGGACESLRLSPTCPAGRAPLREDRRPAVSGLSLSG